MQTLSDISTLKPGTIIRGRDAYLKVIEVKDISIFKGDVPEWELLLEWSDDKAQEAYSQDQVDNYSWWDIVSTTESPEYDWKNELRERMDEFLIHKRDSECICDMPELDLIPLYEFIEEVIKNSK